MPNPVPSVLPTNVRLIDDLHLNRPHVIGTYLLVGDEPAIVDPGPASTLSCLEAGLAEYGIAPGDLRTILLTHIHLDHAGATGSLVQRFPDLRVYVHERGAPHLVRPDKLIKSAQRIYGDAMGRLWGDILPVPEENITTLSGGETIQVADRSLRVFDAPGHASHHLFYFDEGSGTAYLGDNGGVCLPETCVARPATPPPDIDIDAWQHTLDTIASCNPQALLLTHFGPAPGTRDYLEEYRANLLRWSEAVRVGIEAGEDRTEQLDRLRALAREQLGPDAPAEVVSQHEQAAALEMNWQGLARYWQKKIG